MAARYLRLEGAEADDLLIDRELPFSVSGTYGGNTSCVEIVTGNDAFVLCDLGTGARDFGNGVLAKHGPAKANRFNVFLSHQGLGLSDSGIHTTGLFRFGFLTGVLTLLKFLGMIDWSWWRVGFPLGIYVGFQVAYLATGFIYLSEADIEEPTPEEETESLTGYQTIPYFWLAWVNFILFGIGVSEWAELSSVWHGFWQAFANPGVMIAFGSLAEINLFLFWSSISQMLNGCDHPPAPK